MTCPRCHQPVPTNEAVAYNGWHEDCAVSNLPGWRGVQSAAQRHDLGRDGTLGTRGGRQVFADLEKFAADIQGDPLEPLAGPIHQFRGFRKGDRET